MRARALVIGFLIGLASGGIASDVPFFVRSLQTTKDLAGLNENFRSIVNDITAIYTKWMTPTVDNSKALCISPVSGNLSGCTSAVDASGNCTCP